MVNMLTRVFLESLWLLLVVWVAVEFFLICLWSWRRSRITARAVWLGFAAFPLMILLSAWVVTDRERLVLLCRALADAVERADVRAIRAHLAPDFEAGDWDRDQFLNRVEITLAKASVREAHLSGFTTGFPKPDRAEVSFSASAFVTREDFGPTRLWTRWRLNCRRRGESPDAQRGPWLVQSVEARLGPDTDRGGIFRLLKRQIP